MPLRRTLTWIVVCLGIIALALAAWIVVRLWPPHLPARLRPAMPRVLLENGKLGIELRTQVLVADLGDYPRALPAYLRFDFLRSQGAVDASRLFLCAGPGTPGGDRSLFLRVSRDILQSSPYLGSLVAEGSIREFALHTWARANLAACQQQSKRLAEVFRSPSPLQLHEIPDRLLIGPMADFLVFKSETDIRVRKRSDLTLAALNVSQAGDLANDILIVSRFYSLPLEYFLAIGAMENNYLSVRGDLGHAVWKRRPQRGDVILRRVRGRVLVRNYSLGVWQITRETLRNTQFLYLRDRQTRDYGVLPERLRPEVRQDPDDIRPETLTTYAGLLFRNLLDRFDGNVTEAVGAYNGGPLRPNRAYAESVRRIARYARRVIFHAVAIASPEIGSSAQGTSSPARKGQKDSAP